jgi:hypothetical protein
MPKHFGVEIWNVLIKIHNLLEHLLVNGTARWSVQPSRLSDECNIWNLTCGIPREWNECQEKGPHCYWVHVARGPLYGAHINGGPQYLSTHITMEPTLLDGSHWWGNTVLDNPHRYGAQINMWSTIIWCPQKHEAHITWWPTLIGANVYRQPTLLWGPLLGGQN